MSVTVEDNDLDARLAAEDATKTGVPSTGSTIVDAARRDQKRVSEWESMFRARALEDTKFAAGDSENGYQWPQDMLRERNVRKAPSLTINMIRQHNLIIVNEGKKNKTEVRIIGAGNGATALSAQMYQAVVSQIQYASGSQSAYSIAREWQVRMGIGWWRIATRYVDPGERPGLDAFDQEIVILPMPDPWCVFMDPDIKERDGSDANFCLIFTDMLKTEFARKYPDVMEKGEELGQDPLGSGAVGDSMMADSHIRVCEYFRRVEEKDTLISFIDDQTGMRTFARKSLLGKEIWDKLKKDKLSQTREITDIVVKWYLIAGEKIVDETIWPGKHIPLVRVIGEEVVIDGMLDRMGHTRAMKDAQRMYNYNASASVEVGALQTKTPWTASMESTNELEQYWRNANVENKSFLPFKAYGPDGVALPPQALPQRVQPPASSPAFEAGMMTAANQMMLASGQYGNQLGQQGNERTGAAIGKRQEQSDTATFHFVDNYELALIYTGKQLIELIPKIYDTARMVMIDGEDGNPAELMIDPGAQEAYQEEKAEDGEVLKRIFNPNLGKYDVRASSGAAMASRREQTVEGLTMLLTQAPALTGLVGDLLLKAMDFKEANEAAVRLYRMVPPQALGKGMSQQEQQLATQLQQTQAALQAALQADAKNQVKLAGKDQMRDIDVYKAQTDRLKVLFETMPVVPGADQLAEGTVADATGDVDLSSVVKANESAMPAQSGASVPAETPPHPDAQKAPDGEWYLSDPTRKGKYMRIAPLAQERNPKGVISNG